MERIAKALGKLTRKRAYAVFVLCATTAAALPAQTFNTLHGFDGTDGAAPYAALVQATDGALYGTATGGGANGGGTVFKITQSGTLTALYSFCAQISCPDGAFPGARLLQAINGNLYGTAAGGGTHDNGTVFKITPNDTLTTLYRLADGAHPYAGLVQATNGSLYGTTGFGGAYFLGTIFKITPAGTLTTLYSFCSQGSCADGAQPWADLIQAANGDLYGTTTGIPYGYGTVFKITPSGTLTTLHSFTGGADGAYPYAALLQATNGNFYGTTSQGGANAGGTVFKITPSGALSTLYSFTVDDGASPYAGLVQATDGNFYGTTAGGGANDYGTVFKITPSGTLTTLHSFTGGADGANPYVALLQATDGKLYGIATGGGANSCAPFEGCGTVFSLSVGLGPFVKTQPTSGKVGAAVKILGTDLTGATGVSFNGTAALFTVKSVSEITTEVPTGATTGTVQVVTPGGMLSSNVPFRVRP